MLSMNAFRHSNFPKRLIAFGVMLIFGFLLLFLLIYFSAQYRVELVIASLAWAIGGIAVTVLSRNLFLTWFNPLSVYFVVWCSSLSLHYLRLVEFDLLSPRGLFLTILSMLSFLLGCFFAAPKKDTLAGNETSAFLSESTIKFAEKTLYLITFLCLIGSIYWWYRVQQTIGIINAITNPWLFDYEVIWGSLKHVGPMGRLYAFKNYIIPFSFLLITMNPKRKWLYLFFIILGMLLVQGTRRGMFFFGISWGIYAAIISLVIQSRAGLTERVKKVSIFFASLTGLIVIISLVYFAITQNWFAKSFSYDLPASYQAQSKLPPQIADIYLYFCASHSALEPHIERGNTVPFQHFLWVPRKIAHALFPSVFEEPLPMLDYEGVYIPFWWNASPYIKFIYNDFGVLGVIIVPFLLGLISSIIFVKALRSPNPIILMFATYLMMELTRTIIIIGLIQYDGYWTIFLLALWGLCFRIYRKRHETQFHP